VTTYFLRRMLLMIPTFLGITFVVFAITRFVPGGPIDQMMAKWQAASAEGGGISAVEMPPQLRASLEKHYHLDVPFWIAYLYWLKDIATGNLGVSYKYNQPVLGLITARLPVSMYFGMSAFLLTYLVCVPLGIWKAIRHGTAFDFATSALVFIGYSVPGWALGTLLLVLFGGGSFFDVFPLGGFRSPDWSELSLGAKVWDQLHHTILPVFCYAIGSFATLTVLTKNSLLENLGQDYVRTAFAKGLSERRVILVHAMRNSVIPLCTGLGHAISLVMAGSYLIEFVFNIDGIGYLGYSSIVDRDYAVVMGILVFNTFLGLLGNILADVLYVLVDPRIRFS
jgi:microcin C transport system permease protein